MNYNYIDAVATADEVTVWCRDKDGVLIKETHDISEYLYYYQLDNTGKPDAKDLFGRPVQRVNFEDRWTFNKFVESRQKLYESDVSPTYKCLIDTYYNAPLDSPYNVFLYDIEVFFDLNDGNGYPSPQNPYGYINSFQAFDTNRQEYLILKLDEADVVLKDTYGEYPVVTISCRDERELLNTLADMLDERDVDIMAGWYTNGFDLPYIMERAIMEFGEKDALRMFCRDGFKAKRREFINENAEERVEWTLVGRQHLDMLELYKKFIPSEKTSFSLSAVCTEDLGIDKVDYEGDLGELYRENPELFFEYGIHDARLLLYLDRKHQIIRLAVTLSRMNSVFARDVVGSVQPIEMGFLKFCHSRGVVLPDKTGSEKEKFEGAIVYDTISGLHKWGFTVDLTALYPSAMMMLGLSTETMVGQLNGGYQDYISVMTKKDTTVILDQIIDGEIVNTLECSAIELYDLIIEAGWCISANGTIFNGEFGLLSEYVKDRFDTRKMYQRMKKEAEARGDMDEANIYNLYQSVMKIICNSLYGCISNAYFRLYDIRLAKSITLTGQVISKFQAYKANSYVEMMTNE